MYVYRFVFAFLDLCVCVYVCVGVESNTTLDSPYDSLSLFLLLPIAFPRYMYTGRSVS